MTSNAAHYQRLSNSWFWLLILMLCITLFSSGQAHAAKGAPACVAVRGAFCPNPFLTPPPMPPQFDMTGFIQEATLDKDGSAGVCTPTDPRLAGGTVKINGVTVIIPCNTILQMPAATLTWQELFTMAPSDMGLPVGADQMPTQTGMALSDSVPLIMKNGNSPLPSYEIHVQGNVVNGTYIAGLVFISQQSLNISQGIITNIDYANAELEIAVSGPNPSKARVRINDPIGRFGKSHGGVNSHKDVEEPNYDSRFSIDEESPTIHAATGYPMCIPRSYPFGEKGVDDPLCPQANRPRAPNCQSLPAPFPGFPMPVAGQFCKNFMMPPPSNSISTCSGVDCPPDPNYFAPFEVGDYIEFAGTLKVDSKGSYISAHTIGDHLGIYTTPGIMPAYMAIEMELQGTGGQPVNGMPQEATSRVKIVGFTTDPSNLVDIYAVDVNTIDGTTFERLLGAANPSGPPVIGRFKFAPNTGPFLPPTRELRVVSRTLCGDPSQPCALGNNPTPTPGGVIAGQYHAPNFEFIFAENLTLGAATVPANMQDLPFLFCGSGPLATPSVVGVGPVVHQLDPAPWAAPMLTPFFAASPYCQEPPVQ